MIKKYKEPCWTAECDNCGDQLVEFDGVRHWDSKKELIADLKDCEKPHFRQKWFCSEICRNKYLEKKKLRLLK